MRLALALLAGLAAGEAAALSCVPPDVARSYGHADASEDRFVVVHGRLTFDDGLMPGPDPSGQGLPQGAELPARIEGVSLTRAGFGSPFSRDLTLRVVCFGPWCGRLPSGLDVLAFLRVSGTGYVLDLDPCGGSVFPDPTRDMLDTVVACFRDGGCGTER